MKENIAILIVLAIVASIALTTLSNAADPSLRNLEYNHHCDSVDAMKIQPATNQQMPEILQKPKR